MRCAPAAGGPRFGAGPRVLLDRAAAFTAVCLLGSCLVEHHVRAVPTDSMLPWLQPGRTSRADVLQILGDPVRQLEDGRILIWELRDDGYHTMRPADDSPLGPLSLVVVLDGDRVQRVSLVRLWF